MSCDYNSADKKFWGSLSYYFVYNKYSDTQFYTFFFTIIDMTCYNGYIYNNLIGCVNDEFMYESDVTPTTI
jgi:hypothetical protein